MVLNCLTAQVSSDGEGEIVKRKKTEVNNAMPPEEAMAAAAAKAEAEAEVTRNATALSLAPRRALSEAMYGGAASRWLLSRASIRVGDRSGSARRMRRRICTSW
jgi:hypothetical protein